MTGAHNIAAQNFHNNSLISVSLQNQFLIKELMNKELGTQWMYKGSAFHFNLNHFGYFRYGEMKLSAGYSKRFADKITFGLQFHYLLNHTQNYSSKNSFTFDLSFQTVISKKTGFGLMVYNPAKLKYGISGEQMIPIRFIYNYYYKISNNILLFSELEKKIPGAYNACFGMTYHFSQISISSSLSLTNFSFLISTEWKSFLFGIRTDCYYKTGISPTLNLYYFL